MTTLIIPGRPCGIVVLALLTLAGCGHHGDYNPAAHQVDADTARSTLISVLDGWKAGDKPDAWQQKSPPVVVQDFDWMQGAKLTGYEILKEEAIDANLHCDVKLSLEDAQGGAAEKTVTYLVSTSPTLTVFRAMQP